jgi:DNA-binding CsgD family transcriptional regulator
MPMAPTGHRVTAETIFITGCGDIPMSVQAIKGGAIDFLTKPFRDQDLLDAIQQGLARDRAWREHEKAAAALRARFEALSPGERAVMALVVTGRLSKQIAHDLGISEVTVKARRGQVMQKMNAASLPNLARMADKLNLTAENPGAVKPMHAFDLPLGVYPTGDFSPRYQSILSQFLQKTGPRHGEGKQTVVHAR